MSEIEQVEELIAEVEGYDHGATSEALRLQFAASRMQVRATLEVARQLALLRQTIFDKRMG